MKQEETDLLRALKAKHGAIKAYRAAGQLVVVRKPTLEEYQAYFDELGRKKDTMSAAKRSLYARVVVHPDATTARALLDEVPGLLIDATGGAEELANQGVEEVELPKE